MQKLQDSVFSIIKTTNLSAAVFSYLQPTEEFSDKTPHGGILKNTKHGWLALGPKFCVVDLRTGLKVAAHTFGGPAGNLHITVTSVIELPTPLTDNSQQLLISVQCEDSSLICVFHINGSQILRCIQTEVVIAQLAVADKITDGPFACFDGVVIAGTRCGEIFAFDLNRASLMQALKDITQGYENLILNETTPTNLIFLKLNSLHRIKQQRELALENEDHLAVLLNEASFVEGQYIFRNPDGSVRMKAKTDHIRVTVLQYIPQLGSLAVGYNFGAFQIWNLMTLILEFTSQVNVECLPVTHFGFQEPCDDPRAFCYLWVVFSVIDRYEEEEFPLAVMYSLTYQGKRMLSDTKYLYQDFSSATIRFQVELCGADGVPLLGGKCVSCHTYSVNSTLGSEGEESMLNICQLVWECWGDNANSSSQYGMLLFDLDQWYKDQMPATYRLESNAFMSATWCSELSHGACVTLDVRLDPNSVSMYSHATRLEEHFYPNSLKYNCICLNTSEACVLGTIGIQRQMISSLDEVGPTALLNPPRLYNACVSAGLTPLYMDSYIRNPSLEEQRRYLLSVALEARLSRFLKRCAHDWATGSHTGAGCTLTFLVDWCWKRAIDLKDNAKELTAPLFASSAMPDRNVTRCLEHCVQQLTLLTGLLDAVLTKCCNLVVPDALSEMEEKYKGIGTVSLYFQVVQWFLRVGLLPERNDAYAALPYPSQNLYNTYRKRRMKLNRLQDNSPSDGRSAEKSCPLLYIDQLIENEFRGERIHKMWIKGGSECNGLYPPPSLYALLRLYLLPDVAEEHKHSLVLYLLVDYSMVYDEVRYESVIRRLMQFPTMFGLSNTAIKATQAFWHLDHRDFDFALDQLQCLTGNTLSDWQHNVVLSSLLAQKKTQAALQYLHVRKPNPIHIFNVKESSRRENYKLEDWQSCCNLYLARGLVFEALDVIRLSLQNAGSLNDKLRVLEFFFNVCRNTGNLSKLLQVTLQPFEEEVFIRYLDNCNEPQTSDILIMYYLQHNRYLEAERYNNRLRHTKPRPKDVSTSAESVLETMDRQDARDTMVEVACASLPQIANKVATFALQEKDVEPHVLAPKPMSVFVQAKSPKNTFTYKSSFIQDTIENASETWINRPKMRKGLKRVLNVEDTPFICTPKLSRTRSIFSTDIMQSESTPPKRAKLDVSGTPKTPTMGGTFKSSAELSMQMASLLDMPEVQSPEYMPYNDRGGAETPHSILKTKRSDLLEREAPSPVDSRYLADSDDDMLETASNHTHYSDSTNKQLRFTVPTASESESTPSPVAAPAPVQRTRSENETDRPVTALEDKDDDIFFTSQLRDSTEQHLLESPPKKLAVESSVKPRKTFKDSVKARLSLSISANSSLSDDPNTSIESIADIPITLINPRYSKDRHQKEYSFENRSTGYMSETEIRDETGVREMEDGGEVAVKETENETETEDKAKVGAKEMDRLETVLPRTPKGRRAIRVGGESTPLVNRARSVTPERQDSPIATPIRSRITRSRSRTPELSPRVSPLAPILEQPKQELESEPHPGKTTLSAPRQLRSRSRTPERLDKAASESPRLEAITESPTKSPDIPARASPRRRLRSRSRTPEVEMIPEQSPIPASPRILRSRLKTPEKLMSPKKDQSARGKKPLSRLVLEANAFAKTKGIEKLETEINEKLESVIECTPIKIVKPAPSLMDVTFSPIVNKSILQSSSDSVMSENITKEVEIDKSQSEIDLKPLPAFTTIHETYFEKSVLQSYESSIAETSQSDDTNKTERDNNKSRALKSLPAFTTINETHFQKSVLTSYESSTAESSIESEKIIKIESKTPKSFSALAKMIDTDFEKSVLSNYKSSIEDCKDDKEQERTKNEASSLLTNDSDVEIKDQQDQGENAAVIQKEKETIVEIEREIHEIEGDMSDDSEQEEIGSSDEEIIEGEEAEEEESGSSEEESGSSSGDEIISIKDTDDDSDQSMVGSDNLEIVELASEDVPASNDTPTSKPDEISEDILEVQVKMDDGPKDTNENKEASVDPLNQAQESLLTDDNSVVNDSYQSDFHLSYSDERAEDEKDAEKKDVPVATTDPKSISQIQIIVTEPSNATTVEQPAIDSPEKVDTKESCKDVLNISTEKPSPENIEKLTTMDKDMTEDKDAQEPIVKEITDIKNLEEPKVEPVADVVEDLTAIQQSDEKTIASSNSKQVVVETLQVPKLDEMAQVKESIEEESTVTVEEMDTEKSPSKDVKPGLRKRANSTASNKSVDGVKTPITRKRPQSSASNKSATEETTPESPKESTPSRRMAKTPTSEVRRIITRRISKEMGEKIDDSMSLDDLTPKRRSKRVHSKNVDDNESVTSEGSIKSNRSKISEDAGDIKVRKGRKSILATKPDLSVIPEVATEESGAKGEAGDIITDYSNARRLTRNQKAVLESWLEPAPSPSRPPRRTSTASRASRTSVISEQSHDEDDVSSTHSSTFDVQPIDRISLMNKPDFEGSPDIDELESLSSVSPLLSDTSRQRRSRLGRAASESRTVLKPAKVSRKFSVDNAEAGSPVRVGGRRASFNRACEALHTPKGRRTSTDLRKGDTESPLDSPIIGEGEAEAPPTPGRRTRRTASTQSNTSQTTSESGRRSKKIPVTEDKDSK
ncbi:hypothetical protein K1T71_006283 [Dendrolimus kikuchii]|uniref:Uncharacterized protein n=1 Tax=Dendrolimus kikuchii TaxID=765133 RepID=A0ACC1D3V5_9NEOP|nr:hypothetical protein K1T71_006283 [Dendrolimus kikuchii]